MDMRTRLLGLIAAALLVAGPAFAADRGTPEQAKALVERAVQHIKEVGKEKAFEDFNDSKGSFVEGDLYIFVEDMTATNLAHGANKGLIGKSVYDLKDADGKLIGREFIAVAQASGEGWVSYKWPNPISKKIEEKSTYVKKVDDMMILCGAYKS
jgi:signal transduction histidine kinase